MKNFTSKESEKKSLLEEINGMDFPKPSISIDFTLMQKLFAYWLKKKHYFGNWSGTGVGKTYSFILASRLIDAHLTVIVGTNSTTRQLASTITNLYDDNVAVVYDGKLPDFDMSRHNYLIFNYEKGQQEYSQDLFDSLLDKYKVDYIVFDEVQMVKQRDLQCSTRRANFLSFRNNAVERYGSYVSVMTATPYVNSISEVISILTLLTGKDYKHISTKNVLKNTSAVSRLLNTLGILATTEPKNKKGMVVKENVVIDAITGDDSTFKDFQRAFEDGSPLPIYQATLQDKLESIYVNDRIKKGELAIIYIQFIDGIAEQTREFFTDLGYRVCEYTGKSKDTEPYEDKNGSVNWELVKKDFDIILASKPIAVGIDGLQKVSNTMAILSLPWTNADYEQLIGRIKRKNSNFDEVNVYIPMVRFPQLDMVGYDDMVWNAIKTKEVLGSACLKGEFSTEPTSIHKTIVKDFRSKMLGEYGCAA